MRFGIVLILATALSACGGSGEPGEVPGRGTADRSREAPNHPPKIVSVTLYPASPTVRDQLRVSVDVRDPDRDSIDVRVTWIRNGREIRSGPEQALRNRGGLRAGMPENEVGGRQLRRRLGNQGDDRGELAGAQLDQRSAREPEEDSRG